MAPQNEDREDEVEAHPAVAPELVPGPCHAQCQRLVFLRRKPRVQRDASELSPRPHPWRASRSALGAGARRCRPLPPAERPPPPPPRRPPRHPLRLPPVYEPARRRRRGTQYVYVASRPARPACIDYVARPALLALARRRARASWPTAGGCSTTPTQAQETTGNFVPNGLGVEVDVGARIERRYIPYLGRRAGPRRRGAPLRGNRRPGRYLASWASAFGCSRETSTTSRSISDLSFGFRKFQVSSTADLERRRASRFFALGRRRRHPPHEPLHAIAAARRSPAASYRLGEHERRRLRARTRATA